MIAKYKIDATKNILYEVFYGEITLEDLGTIVEHQMQQPEFKQVNKTLSDIRLANIVINNSQLEGFMAELKGLFEATPLSWGIVAENPRSTALSMIIKSDSFFSNKVEIFSTLKGASDFLNVDIATGLEDEEGYVKVDR